ncbi:MAG: nucleotidyltransferase family protein [Prevotella sp.]
MSLKNRSVQLFLALFRSGLWGTRLECDSFADDVDWDMIFQLAGHQTVNGIIADGLVQLPIELRPDREHFYKMLMRVSRIEDANRKMNRIIPRLFNYLSEAGCSPLLLKGQGIGLAYMCPEHRQSGDIDVFIGFDENSNECANRAMRRITSDIGENNRERRHAEYTVGGVSVEIHGTIRSSVSRHCNRHFGAWAAERMEEDEPRRAVIDGREVLLPSYRFDVVFIFVHLLGHFLGGGIGLRQVCDWMMFLHTYHDKISQSDLEKDLERLGLRRFWEVFASMAVCHLGFPVEEMPYYDCRNDKKGTFLLKRIFATGNFGALQKEKQLKGNVNKYRKKLVTLFGQIPVYVGNFPLFPKDTMYCFYVFVRNALKVL